MAGGGGVGAWRGGQLPSGGSRSLRGRMVPAGSRHSRRPTGLLSDTTEVLAARVGTERFLGLTATVLGVLFLHVAAVWTGSAFGVRGDPSVTSADTRLAILLDGMRDARLVALLGWITDAGGRHGVLPMLAGASIALLVLRRFDPLGGLWIAAVGNRLNVTPLRAMFARPRLALGYFVGTSGSFPSGPAAGAAAVSAMLFYLGWGLWAPSAGVTAAGAVAVVFAIALGRVYLMEHSLSDVLNLYLVGGLWLILWMAFCATMRPCWPWRWRGRAGPPRRTRASACSPWRSSMAGPGARCPTLWWSRRSETTDRARWASPWPRAARCTCTCGSGATEAGCGGGGGASGGRPARGQNPRRSRSMRGPSGQSRSALALSSTDRLPAPAGQCRGAFSRG